MRLTRHELDGCAEFLNDSSFRLHSCAFAGEILLGLYELLCRSGEAHTYRLHHPLADAVIAQAKCGELPMAEIERKLQQRLKTTNLFAIRWSLS